MSECVRACVLTKSPTEKARVSKVLSAPHNFGHFHSRFSRLQMSTLCRWGSGSDKVGSGYKRGGASLRETVS